MTRFAPSRLALGALAAALLATTALAVPALAQDTSRNTLPTGAYGGVTGGYLMPRDTDGAGGSYLERENGYSVSGQYGYRFPNNLRLESELGYGKINNDRFHANGTSTGVGGDIDQYSLTGAAFYDIATGTPLTPYVGGGAGVMHQQFDRNTVRAGSTTLRAADDSTDFTAFGETGLAYRVSKSTEIVPSYRYQWINDGQNGLDDSTQHVARLGLRSFF